MQGFIRYYFYKFPYYFGIKIYLAYIYKLKLLITLKYITNKSYNIMKLFNRVFFLLNLKLFLNISKKISVLHFCSKKFFVFTK